jgi:hypothetical protein
MAGCDLVRVSYTLRICKQYDDVSDLGTVGWLQVPAGLHHVPDFIRKTHVLAVGWTLRPAVLDNDRGNFAVSEFVKWYLSGEDLWRFNNVKRTNLDV